MKHFVKDSSDNLDNTGKKILSYLEERVFFEFYLLYSCLLTLVRMSKISNSNLTIANPTTEIQPCKYYERVGLGFTSVISYPPHIDFSLTLTKCVPIMVTFIIHLLFVERQH